MNTPTRRPRRPWTPDESRQLRDLVASGDTLPAIAAKLDRDYNVIRLRAARMGLTWRAAPRRHRWPLPGELPEGSAKAALYAAADAWLEHLRLQGLASSSIKTYRSLLSRTFLGLDPDHGPADLRLAVLARVGPEGTAQTRSEFFNALTAFYSWWAERGGPVSPVTGIRRPRYTRLRRRGLTADELNLLAQRVERAGARERAIAAILVLAGARVGEATRLRAEDIDFAGGLVRLHGKGGRIPRHVPMSPELAGALRHWLQVGQISTGPVFRSEHRPEALTGQGLRQAWYRMVGPDLRHVKPHMCRHSFASILDRAGTRTTVISKLLGHSSVAVTERYLDDDPQAARAAVESVVIDLMPRLLRSTAAAPVVAGPSAVAIVDGDAVTYLLADEPAGNLACEMLPLLDHYADASGLAVALADQLDDVCIGIGSTWPQEASRVIEVDYGTGMVRARDHQGGVVQRWRLADYLNADWSSQRLDENPAEVIEPGFLARMARERLEESR